MGQSLVAVLGTGLIGGSIALGLRARAPDIEIVGYDRDPAVLARALELGAVHHTVTDPLSAVSEADVVVVAVPVDRIPAACATLAGHVPTTTVVTDVGSAKVEVVRAGEAAFGEMFVGGHPMAGSERHGIEAADPALFDDAWWILTPTEMTSSEAYSRAGRLAANLGARAVAVDPTTHDALVARLSHVPQLTASALVQVAARAGDREALLGLAGRGFRDVTRIAASEPDLWVAILRSNKASVLDELGHLRGSLEEVAGFIAAERWDELAVWLGGARRARLDLFAKPDLAGESVVVSMPVPDRPGVLAEVTTAATKRGSNIEDLRIIHSTEGGRGRLELVVVGWDQAGELGAALEELGYRVELTSADDRDKST